jgi:hypothetical protein
MDYKSIIKSWVNDLDQQAAKDVCLQFGLIETPSVESLIGKTFKEERYLAELFKEFYKEYSSLKAYRVPLRLFFMVAIDGSPIVGYKEWQVHADYDTKTELFTITKITER